MLTSRSRPPSRSRDDREERVDASRRRHVGDNIGRRRRVGVDHQHRRPFTPKAGGDRRADARTAAGDQRPQPGKQRARHHAADGLADGVGPVDADRDAVADLQVVGLTLADIDADQIVEHVETHADERGRTLERHGGDRAGQAAVGDGEVFGAHQQAELRLPAAIVGCARRADSLAAHSHLGRASHLGGELVHRADEAGDERSGRAAIDLGRRTQLLDATLRHDTDAVADGQRLLLVVGDEQGGDADLGLDPADLVAQRGAHLGVERAERLVEQQHLGLHGQRPGERDTLLLAAGELVRVALGRAAPSSTSSSISATRLSALGLAASGVCADRTRRSWPRSGWGTGCSSGTPCPCCACAAGSRVMSVPPDQDRRRVGELEAGGDAQRGGLAAPARAEQGDQLAFLHLEIEARAAPRWCRTSCAR